MKLEDALNLKDYECAMCKEVFAIERPYEEAKEEFLQNKKTINKLFPEESADEIGIVCEDCYQILKAKYPWLI